MMPLSLEEFMMGQQIHLLKLEGWKTSLKPLSTCNLEWMSILRLTPKADHPSSRDKPPDREDGSQLLSAASVHPMTTIQVSVLLRSNMEWMSILRITPIADHHSSRDKALDREDGSQVLALRNQKPAPIAKVCGVYSSNDHHTSVCPSSQHSGFSARNDAIVIKRFLDVATDTSAETRKPEGKLDVLVNLVTHLTTNQKPASIARVCGIHSSNDRHTSVCPSSQQSGVDEQPEAYSANTYSRPPKQGVHDVVTDTSAETRKLEGKLDANQKPASVARVYGIRSSNDHHTTVCPSSQQSGVDDHPEAYVANTYSRPPQQGVHDVATDTSVETRKLEGKLDALVNCVCPSSQQSGVNAYPEAYAANTYSRPPHQEVHDVAKDTSAEIRKLEGKLDALVNLETQLAANQKPASVAKVCGIRSSNDHHTSVCRSSQQSGFSARNDAIVLRGVHDMATDTSAETRKLEGKLDALVNLFSARNDAIVIKRFLDVATDTSAETRKPEGKLDVLVNLVTQLTANQKPASIARVCGIHSSNDRHTSFNARNDAIIIRGVHDVVTDTSAETRKLEGKLDALVKWVTQLDANQKPASVARVYGIRSSNDNHTSVSPSSQQSGVDEHLEAHAANTYSRPPQGVHDVATDTSAETRKLEGKVDALVKWVTQLDANQKPASVERVCVIRSFNDHHTSVCPSSQQSRVDDNPEAYAANTYSRPPQGVHDVATDTSAETRKLEGKVDALVNLVTQLAANQKPASVARVYVIRSFNDHHTSRTTIAAESRHLIEKMAPNSMQFCARNDIIVIRGVHDVATDTSTETRKLEESAASILPMTTILLSVLLRSNLEWMTILRLMLQTPIVDHHSSREKALDRQDGSQLLALEGKLDALVNLVTQLAANQKPAVVARVCGIHSSDDHHTSVCPSSQQSGVDDHPEAYAASTYRPPQQGVHDVARETAAETRKLEGKLDALIKLVTQLAANQKPVSVGRVCDIRSSNDHHTSVCPSSQQSGVDEHPEAYAATPIVGHHNSRDKALDREDGSQFLATTTTAETRDLIEKIAPRSSQFNVGNDAIVIRGVLDVATDTSAETRKLEGKLDSLVNLVTQLAANQKPVSVGRVCGIHSSNDHHTSFSARNDAIVIRGVHDVATNTSAETKKLEGKLDANVNLVTQLAASQKLASIAIVFGIRSSNDHHTSETTTVVETRHLMENIAPNSLQFSARNDSIVIRGVHDVATNTSIETRKLEGKLDALVNLVTQLAACQKLASVARVFGIRSSNDHHTNVFFLRSKRKWMIILRLMLQTPIGDHHSSRDKALDREDGSQLLALEGKLDALVNLVTQLAVNQKSAFVTRVCGIRSSNDHHTSVCPSSQQSGMDEHPEQQTPIADHHSRVQDVATDTSAETRKLEGKLVLFNLEWMSILRLLLQTPLADHHNSRDKALDTSAETRKLQGKIDALQNLFSATNDAIIIRGVHDVATDTSVETRKLEGKVDALGKLATQLATNHKTASVARVCGIHYSNDHHTSVYPSLQKSGVDQHPEAYTANTYSRPPQHARNDVIVIKGVQDMPTDTSAETRKLEDKLDAHVNLVTHLAANQKPASVVTVCGIRTLNDHHISVCPSSQQSGEDEHSEFSVGNDVIVIRRVHDVATDTSAETRKLEGKLDTLFSARNDAIVIRGVRDVATDTSAKTRKLEGKLDAPVNLVTQLAQSGVDEHIEAYARNTYSTPPQQAESRHLREKMVPNS
ncbi:hypothetical protein Fmac_028550 [Flemingia macrophylla]|uniref:Uncharacterized protein n=1 Tax=Flemingia macrophylla TaxID=520843 RepID=A0ABD1L7W1_9FABA